MIINILFIIITMFNVSKSYRLFKINLMHPSKPKLWMNVNDVDLSTSANKKPKGKSKEDSKYSKTILLPLTTFEQRANSLNKEPEMQRWWNENKIYENLIETNTGEKFILHDGPPYANGNLHIGHALNKILKDFINRYQILKNRKVQYVPGWDCHGLPIELKVLQSMKTKERESLTPIELRKKAAGFANSAIQQQKESFKRYGVWGDWETPYATLQPEYEAAQIKVFGEMFTNGHIYRGKKPVYWSPSSKTALAEAELEYPENHVSRSIYVGFKVTNPSESLQKSCEASNINVGDVVVAIWTTTPWTIPANLAVAVNANLEYCITSHPSISNGSKYFIVAKDLISSFSAVLGLPSEEELKIVDTLKGSELENTEYQHPLYMERKSKIVIGGDYITTESGTGLVHTAPGHGQEDYLTGLKYNLPLLSPVDDNGRFTIEAGEKFVGLDVLGDGNTAVITALNETGSLIKEQAYKHKYPYDWRTKKPTIFRATEQWFASVSSFRQNALDAIDKVEWIPAIGRNRIASMTESRGDWCISRQRTWGVPIPVFYKKTTNEPLMTVETLSYIESIFKTHGSDAWWEMDIANLLPIGPLRDQSEQYTKGTDTMDVWFDSGTSWAGVVKNRDVLRYPADIYLEGSDQHRGWFQSSLLTSVASQGRAPYKTVLTHGFVLDEKGYKMSKSLGNVVDPTFIIEGGSNQKENPAFGADTLRMWVSGVDYTSDVCLGQNIMKQVSETYRKLRNTMRYILGSLSDFNPEVDSITYEALPSIDKHILGRLTSTVNEVETGFNEYQFYKANQALNIFASNELSAFYLDIAKDRLYISSKNDYRRRSCQTVLRIVLEQMAVLMAPIVPHMAEEIWQSIPYNKKAKSVFQAGWIKEEQISSEEVKKEENLRENENNEETTKTTTVFADRFLPYKETYWNSLKTIRIDANKCMELARQAKEIGASMESRVVLYSENIELNESLKTIKGDEQLFPFPLTTNNIDDLRFIFITSQVLVVDSIEELKKLCPTYSIDAKDSISGVNVGVSRAVGAKCERCWYYSENVGEDSDHKSLCLRCANVVKTDGYVV